MKYDIEEMHRDINVQYKSQKRMYFGECERQKYIQWTLNDIKKRPGAMFLIPYTHSIYTPQHTYRDDKKKYIYIPEFNPFYIQLVENFTEWSDGSHE